MIVDDDPAVCFTVREVLSTAGLEVVECNSGQACLDILQHGWTGVILLDIMMPEMDGWQTLQALRDRGLLEGCIVSMLTAVMNPGPEMEDLKECVLDYIRKPFDADVLIASVRDYLSYLQPVG
jgi:CheY-like chemotaxis protein